MTLAHRALPFALFVLTLLTPPATAQTPPTAPPPAPAVTVTVTSSGVRLSSLGAVGRTRLEVYDSSGAVVFDSGLLPGNVRDFSPRAAGLADGPYTFALTSRELSGRLSIKQAAVVLSGGEAAVALGEGEAGEVGRGAPSSTDVGEAGAATVATHDGRAGALTSTSGDLTLRTGDVLRGEEKEHVRVTTDGRVGVGTAKPEATLDVAGAVRAAGGFKFSDGTTLQAAGGRLTLTNEQGDTLPGPAAAGTGTQNRVAKWAETGGAGTLTDSSIFESGGLTVFGQSAPLFSGASNFHVVEMVATGTKTPLTLVGGSGSMEFWKDSASGGYPTRATAFGMATPGQPTTNDMVFSTYAPNAWSERMRITNAGNVGIGTNAPQARLDVAGDVRASGAINFVGLRTEATSQTPNVVGGFLGTGAGGATPGNRVTPGVVGAAIGGGGLNGSFATSTGGSFTGDVNRVTDSFGTVGGGLGNRAGDNDATPDNHVFATVGGGYSNVASAYLSTVGGGASNVASGNTSTVGGGVSNLTSEIGSTVGGGYKNVASGYRSTVGGGSENTASGENSTVGGGEYNIASDNTSTVGGGYSNVASGRSSTVPGGVGNTASGLYSFAAGVSAKAVHDSTFVWNGAALANFTSTNVNQFLINASGGVGINTPSPFAALHVNGSSVVTGNLGVGTISPSVRLDVNGSVRVAALGSGGSTSLCLNGSSIIAVCSSSLRYKTNVLSFGAGLDVVRRLRPVSFTWKEGGMRDLGLVAEEVSRVEPLLVSRNAAGQVEGVKYEHLNVVLINAVREQQQQLATQEQRLELKEARIAGLEARLAALERPITRGHATTQPARPRPATGATRAGRRGRSAQAAAR